jgi:hypothetical protein
MSGAGFEDHYKAHRLFRRLRTRIYPSAQVRDKLCFTTSPAVFRFLDASGEGAVTTLHQIEAGFLV